MTNNDLVNVILFNGMICSSILLGHLIAELIIPFLELRKEKHKCIYYDIKCHKLGCQHSCCPKLRKRGRF